MTAEKAFTDDDVNKSVKVTRTKGGTLELKIKDVTLFLPNENSKLVDNFNIALRGGDRLILTGDPGSGKSTVVRAIKNLWPNAIGNINFPEKAKILCLSQKVHFPRTDLASILCSPLSREEAKFSFEEMDQALDDVGLDFLRKQLAGNQAKPEFLFQKMAPYLTRATEHWSNFISTQPKRQRELLCRYINKHIRNDAANFFSDDIIACMKDDNKAQLANMASEALQSMIADIPFKSSFFDFMNFDGMLTARQKNYGDQITRYILQGTATEIAALSKDGNQLSRQLSGGQQQLLMAAQVLLHKPDILIMDEPTAALNQKFTEKFYKLVFSRLPDSIVISISHNADVIVHHTLHGHLENQKIEVKQVDPAKAPPPIPAPAP